MTGVGPVLATCQALLIDLDGTLLDTTHAVEASWQRAAEHLGISFTRFEPFMHGIPAGQVIDQIVPGLTRTERNWVVDRVLADQMRDDAIVRWMPGGRELVDDLKGVAWAVVTSSTRLLAESSMRKAGMPQPPFMVTADDVGIGKPHPAPFLRAAYLLHTRPAECVAIEDSPAGIASATQAGIPVIAVAGTYAHHRLASATMLVDRLPGVARDPLTQRIVVTQRGHETEK